MELIRWLPVFFVLFLQSNFSHACGGSLGWVNAASSAPSVTLARATEIAKTEHGVKIEKSRFQARCSLDTTYDISDAITGKLLGTIPLPYADERTDDGRTLQARLQQLLETPRETLNTLANLPRIFYDDVRGLREDLGIGGYVPNALPLEERTANHGQDYLLYVSVEKYCYPQGGFMTPANTEKTIYVKTLEYIPGRKDYPSGSYYQKGDFKKAVLGDSELMSEIKAIVAGNVQYCRQGANETNWAEVDARLKGDPAILSQTAVDAFTALPSQPQGAFMLNENRIAIQFAGTTSELAGPVYEMVEIQNLLKARGIQTDKKTRLDWKGKIDADTRPLREGAPARQLPESLKD